MSRPHDPTNPFSPASGRKAVLYARVSSKEQEKEGFSIPAQQKLLRDYAQNQNMSIAREFIDVETARRAGRTGFAELLTFLRRRSSACRILLVEKTDRLYRNLRDWATIDDLDIDIHFVKENVVLSPDSRSTEKFIHGIKALMAKNFIDNLSEETRKGMQEKAEQGIWPSFAPLGYRNIKGSNGKRVIEPDPGEAPIVVRIFERYATGNHSILEVTRMARADGLISRRSKNPVSRARVHKTLRNPLYMGEFKWKGRIYPGIHDPLISPELWQRVGQVLDGRRITRHRKAKHD
ncbi:MAG: recombinase family protein, partial [Candidatus Eisenbacteria sp.]|nr:recombinase family protein [Candidatus Eisenbacteria bacterium]